MGKYEVRVTRQAREQLQEIVHYVAKELLAPDAAANLLEKMEEAMASLAEMPGRIRPIQEEPWRSQGVRKIIVKNFFIYFWSDEENARVQVVAVIYSRRDQIHRLMDMEW